MKKIMVAAICTALLGASIPLQAAEAIVRVGDVRAELAALNSMPGARALLKQKAGACQTRCHKQDYYPYDTICTQDCDGNRSSGGGGGGRGPNALGWLVILGGGALLCASIWK